MKQTLKNMRIRKWMGVLFAAVLMTALGAQTALASTDYVKSVSITLDVAPVPGEDLPALHYGYTGDTGYEVKIPSNERYEIVSAEWGSKVDEARLGGTYTIKITLETLNDYPVQLQLLFFQGDCKRRRFCKCQETGKRQASGDGKNRSGQGRPGGA